MAAVHHDWDPATAYPSLLDALAEARFVLIGEATHGTSEFYDRRARISRHLIERAGFDAVAAEADWPDAHRAGCYARVIGDDDVHEALATFDRFPRWSLLRGAPDPTVRLGHPCGRDHRGPPAG